MEKDLSPCPSPPARSSAASSSSPRSGQSSPDILVILMIVTLMLVDFAVAWMKTITLPTTIWPHQPALHNLRRRHWRGCQAQPELIDNRPTWNIVVKNLPSKWSGWKHWWEWWNLKFLDLSTPTTSNHLPTIFECLKKGMTSLNCTVHHKIWWETGSPVTVCKEGGRRSCLISYWLAGAALCV